jgi:hypothetical protein
MPNGHRLNNSHSHHTHSTTKDPILYHNNMLILHLSSSINNSLTHHSSTRSISNIRNNLLSNRHPLSSPQSISSMIRSRSLYPPSQAIEFHFPSHLFHRILKRMLYSAHSAKHSSRIYGRPCIRTRLQWLLSAHNKPHFRPHIHGYRPSSANYSNSTQRWHPTNRSSRAQ